jgi:hypothetical protein
MPKDSTDPAPEVPDSGQSDLAPARPDPGPGRSDPSPGRPDPGPGRSEPADPASATRDLTERFQELIERMNTMGQVGVPNLLSGWMSLLEAGVSLTSFPMRHMQALIGTIRTQRDQVRALQAQLEVFEQQLTALEKSLKPLVDWAEQWTRAQQSMLGQVRSVTKTER